MVEALNAQLSAFSAPQSEPKEGLTQKDQDRLRAVVRPDSHENPWLDPFVRARNQLVVELLLAQGTRKGEALKQQIKHIDVTANEMSIVRNPDDPKDPRKREPNVKRVGRVLPLEQSLSDMICDYIVDWRSKLPRAHTSDYLLVNRNGEPLSKESVQKVFVTLRRRFPEFPPNLAAHLMRHTWNDNFSAVMDKNKVSSTDEVRSRSYLMGWRETSGTAARYTKRSTRKRAAERAPEGRKVYWRGTITSLDYEVAP